METLLRLCDRYDVNLDILLRGSVEESRVEDTVQYDRFMNGFIWRVALSVGGIILGAALMVLLETLAVPEALYGSLFLMVVTVAVVVLVVSGIQHRGFCVRHPRVTDFYTQEQRDTFQRKFTWLVAGGVGAILFALVLLAFAEQLTGELFYEEVMTAVFLAIVAGAVTAFVYAGLQNGKYHIERYNRENDPLPEAKARLSLIRTICSVLMVSVTAVYVGLGLALDLWRTAWWLFAVGGILCSVVKIILNPYRGME